MNKWLFLIIAILLGLLAIAVYEIKEYGKKYETAMANIKNYDLELSAAKNKNTAYQLTVDQLEYFNDSVLKALDETRKELGIKDKNLKALQAIYSGFTKEDTLWLPGDTIFKEPTLALDTLFGDEWYSLKLGLKYPSMIAVKPYFKSEKHVIVSSKKETVNPPKKFFLFRWFQKKHVVLHIDVVEKNPYVDNETSKFIEIIK